jgi:hypothetical protein
MHKSTIHQPDDAPATRDLATAAELATPWSIVFALQHFAASHPADLRAICGPDLEEFLDDLRSKRLLPENLAEREHDRSSSAPAAQPPRRRKP